ncbi:Apoptosis inhibitor 5 [Orchesella cincta]|uniref:Apoptosis inhibitor 5 n=1 Tax=Orchesella cincta TaxID=48709 RepID=A0A1D2MS43_ORCCI|nr:Apoptosis inhibitor 5 [Orchesella cincta]
MTGSGGGSTATTKQRTVSTTDDPSRAAIEKMYKIYEQLNSAEDKSLLEHQFGELLTAVHGSEKEKRLSSQFITRFLEYFPRLEEKAINSLLDLCEDDDVSIRKQAEKDLITVCKKLPHVVPKIADVFAQLMQTNDNSELSVIHNSLVSLLHINAKSAIVGLYAQIKTGEPVVKDRCFKFLTAKLKDLGPEIINLEFEKRLLSETRRILPDLTGEEFKVAMALLNDSKILKTLSGQQAIVDMVANLLDLKKDFDPTEEYSIQKLLILYVLHKLGGQCPEFFSEDPDRLKDFRGRLQYLARATQAYMKKLREDLQNKKGEELKKEENRVKIAALKTLANITAVIRDLFHHPPSYKTTIGLSWRPLARLGGAKRKSATGPEITTVEKAKVAREGPLQIYQPPSGKFSARAGNYTPQRQGGRGGGQQGNFRNRFRGGGGRPFRGGGGGRFGRF